MTYIVMTKSFKQVHAWRKEEAAINASADMSLEGLAI
jgi:hypothetical protein